MNFLCKYLKETHQFEVIRMFPRNENTMETETYEEYISDSEVMLNNESEDEVFGKDFHKKLKQKDIQLKDNLIKITDCQMSDKCKTIEINKTHCSFICFSLNNQGSYLS